MRYVLFILAMLSGCAETPQSDLSGSVDGEDFRDKRFIEACDYSDVVRGSPAYEREVARCKGFEQAHQKQKRALQYSALTNALYKGDCDFVAEQLAGPLSALENDVVFEAGRHRKGLCSQVDPGKALELLQDAVQNDPNDPVALAHLGDMLWKGEGGAQDKERADKLFAQAARNALPNLIRQRQISATLDLFDPKDQWQIDSVEGYFWSFTNLHLAGNFAHPVLGPWVLPPPLYVKRLRLEDVVSKSAQALLQESEIIHSTGGDADKNAAVEILFVAADAGMFKASEALAKLLLEESTESYPKNLAPYAENRKCEARALLQSAANGGSYSAMVALSEPVLNGASETLPPHIFERLMTNAELTRYDLYDLVGDEKRSAISALHRYVASVLAYGFPVPDAFRDVARRVITEAQSQSVINAVRPEVWLNPYFERNC